MHPPETQRMQIIEAAIAEFSRAGLAGARVDAIAARAGVNKRMLYHYVGDKQALFDSAVLACRARLLARLEAGMAPARLSVDDWRVLCAAVAASQSPDLNAEYALPSTAPAQDALLVSLALELLDSLWPELGARILGFDGPGSACSDRLQELADRLGAVAPVGKPRVKLKPALRPPI